MGNNIYSNGDLGIDLDDDGITRNDRLDPDPGTNNLQNAPVITSAVEPGGTATVTGVLNSLPATRFQIQLYRKLGGHTGVGGVFASVAQDVTTDERGDASFTMTLPAITGLPSRYFVTATNLVTGDTSEFSQQPPIGGTARVKFHDRDGDAFRDAGEEGLPGFIVYLDANDNKALDLDEARDTTAADGSYLLIAPADGLFVIREVPKSGYRQTTPDPAPVALKRGAAAVEIDIGNQAVPVPFAVGGTLVKVFNADGSEKFELNPFEPGFTGGVRTAQADVTGDGIPDVIAVPGPGHSPLVRVFNGAGGDEVASFLAFEESFKGGLFVAAGDLDGDGRSEVVVTPDQGGGPVVAVYRGADLAAGVAGELARFFGIDDPDFRGGARPALGDVNGDGAADLVVSAGFLGGPRIAVFDGSSIGGTPVKLLPDFFAFEPGLRNGAFVAAGDVTGDGVADVAFGGGPGGAPRVRLFDGAALLAAGPFTNLDEVGSAQRANFFAGDVGLRGGVRLALKDADGDGRADLVTGSGEGEPSRVRVFLGPNLLANATPSADQELDPFGAVLADGVFVG